MQLGEKVQVCVCCFHEIYLDSHSSTLRAESFRLMHINWLKPLMASYGLLLGSWNLFKLRDETFSLSFVSPSLLRLSFLWPCLSRESNLHHGKWWWWKIKKKIVANGWSCTKHYECISGCFGHASQHRIWQNFQRWIQFSNIEHMTHPSLSKYTPNLHEEHPNLHRSQSWVNTLKVFRRLMRPQGKKNE